MNFTCPKCNTGHSVADEQVPGTDALRFTCPSCGHAIGVRRRDDRAAGEARAVDAADAIDAALSGEEWYVLAADAQQGPLSHDAVAAMLGRGELTADSLAWREGMGDWQPLHDIAAFAPALSVAAPNPFDGFSSEMAQPPAAPAEFSQEVRQQGPSDDAYVQAAPGEATQVFMMTAGIFRHRRNTRLAAIGASIATVLLAAIIVGDLTGVIAIPVLGAVYDFAGLKDPNRARAIRRTEARLTSSALSPQERDELRHKLMGLAADAPRAKGHTGKPTAAASALGAAAAAAVAAPGALNNTATPEKKDPPAKQADGTSAATRPAGLSPAVISKVIADNNRSMGLCLTEATRKGESLKGKMEVQITIDASGSVTNAQILASKYKRSAMGSCTVRRVKGWKFPPFNGEPVTVAFPYVLSTGS